MTKSKSATDNSVTLESSADIKEEPKNYIKNYKDGPGKFCRNQFGLLDNVDY